MIYSSHRSGLLNDREQISSEYVWLV